MKRIEKILQEKANLIDTIKGINSRCGRLLSVGDKPLILSIDYDVSNQKLIEYIARKNNWDIITAYDGEEALNLFNSNLEKLSAIFLQNRIPLIGGFELSHYFLEKKKRLSHYLPIIALSSDAISDYEKRYTEAGADFYLPKPYYQREIAALIALVLFQTN